MFRCRGRVLMNKRMLKRSTIQQLSSVALAIVETRFRSAFQPNLCSKRSAQAVPRLFCSSCTIDMGNPLIPSFESYRNYLNELNDKRERLVKCSRDVTQQSKKVIFQVHRISGNDKASVLKQAEKDLQKVTAQHLMQIAKELQGNDNDIWKLRRAYSPGMQEYVEAATTLEFCKTGKLLTLDEINDRLACLGDPSISFKINVIDYLLGIGDLTGELMRIAISQVAEGEIDMAKTIGIFVRDLYANLSLIAPIMDDSFDMNKKMETMLQSLVKIENACYTVHVRGSEYIPDPETTYCEDT